MTKKIPPVVARGDFSLQRRAPLPMPSAMGGTVFHEPGQGVTWSYSDLCPRPSAVALASPLKYLYYSIDNRSCQALFLFFFFLPRPAVPLPEARGCVLSAWFTFIYRTTGLHAVALLLRALKRGKELHRLFRLATLLKDLPRSACRVVRVRSPLT